MDTHATTKLRLFGIQLNVERILMCTICHTSVNPLLVHIDSCHDFCGCPWFLSCDMTGG